MLIPFTKMHGLGNDFVVINAVENPVSPTVEQIRGIADRHRGIGCDQLLIVDPPDADDIDFCYRIYNADGGEVEQCGNGVRCLFRFVREQGLTGKDELIARTLSSTVRLSSASDNQVTVDMGRPQLEPADIPFAAPAREVEYALDIGSETVAISAVSMGNPHAVVFVEDIARAPIAAWGPVIESHDRFPQRANVGFMQIVDRGFVRLRVYERGAGETQACGTGACAAVVAGRLRTLLNEEVRVELPGGELMIRWDNEAAAVLMTGPAEQVYEGQIEL